MKESDIQSAIMTALTEHPRVVWAMVTTTGRVKAKGYWVSLGIPGLPDIVGMLRGGMSFGIEVKTPGNRPTELQEGFIALCTAHGGVYGWADSVDSALDIIGRPA